MPDKKVALTVTSEEIIDGARIVKSIYTKIPADVALDMVNSLLFGVPIMRTVE